MSACDLSQLSVENFNKCNKYAWISSVLITWMAPFISFDTATNMATDEEGYTEVYAYENEATVIVTELESHAAAKGNTTL